LPIAGCRLPIADLWKSKWLKEIGNRQLAIGNKNTEI
jgi:hypothetical protein